MIVIRKAYRYILVLVINCFSKLYSIKTVNAKTVNRLNEA